MLLELLVLLLPLVQLVVVVLLTPLVQLLLLLLLRCKMLML